MEKKIYNDDVERIVNDPERQEKINAFYQNKKVNRQKRMLDIAIICAALVVIFSVLSAFGLLVNWIAYPSISSFAAISAFYTGRFFENGKVFGWY